MLAIKGPYCLNKAQPLKIKILSQKWCRHLTYHLKEKRKVLIIFTCSVCIITIIAVQNHFHVMHQKLSSRESIKCHHQSEQTNLWSSLWYQISQFLLSHGRKIIFGTYWKTLIFRLKRLAFCKNLRKFLVKSELDCNKPN